MREIKINANDSMQRLDKFIKKYLPRIPDPLLYKGLRKNCVRINGKHVRQGNTVLHEGDVLTLYFADEFFESKSAFICGRSDIDVVYEDKNIIIVNKEEGLLCHSGEEKSDDTLLSRIQSYLYKNGEYSPESEHAFAPSLCNRIDRNTGGLVIAAKNAAALRAVNEKIKSREIHKYYVCIADGHFQKKSGILENYLVRADKKVIISDDPSAGKIVRTGYRVLYENDSCSLLDIELLTGRTHQIRAQLAYSGHPLSGDAKYGGSDLRRKYYLFAYRLSFEFTSDAGILSSLSSSEFSVPFDAEEFFMMNS